MNPPWKRRKRGLHASLMTAAKRLILIAFLYLLVSISLAAIYQLHLDESWFQRHARWTYLAWVFLGPLTAVKYAWQELAAIWKHLPAFIAGGLVIVPFLAAPLFRKGRLSARLCGLGLVLWIALAASLVVVPEFDEQIERLIAAAADLP
jgi:hypothetical protein